MARSLKSKRRKKLNAIKRERYGRKELIRLKKMLGLPTADKPVGSADSGVKNEPEISEIANVIDIKEVQQLQHPTEVHDVDEAEMDGDDDVLEIRMKRTHKIRKSYRPNARIKGIKGSKDKDKTGGATISKDEDQMEHDQRKHFNTKTLRDQHGNYPSWMNQKTVKKLAKQNKRMKRLAKKKKKEREGTRKRSHKYSKETMETDTAGLTEAIVGLQKFGVNTASL